MNYSPSFAQSSTFCQSPPRHSLCSSTGAHWCEHPDEYPEELVSRIIERLKERREVEHHEHGMMVTKGEEPPSAAHRGFVASAPATADTNVEIVPERTKKILPNMMMPDLVATFFAPVQGISKLTSHIRMVTGFKD